MFVDTFFSEAAWRLIPLFTSLISLFGFGASLMLLGISKRNHVSHLKDVYQQTAHFIHRRAWGRVTTVFILVLSGFLFGIGTLEYPPPPTTGLALALWINHYAIGVLGLNVNRIVILELRDRLRFEDPSHG